MSTLTTARALPLTFALAIVSLQAAGQARPDPLDAQAAVPPPLHRSATAGYRGMSDEDVQSWRDANARVARIGGWKAYAREAQAPQAAASAAEAPAAQPAPAPGTHHHHQHHHHHHHHHHQ